MNKKYFTYIIFLLLLLISCSIDNRTFKRTTIAMGSIVEIQVQGVNEVKANKAINIGFEEVKRLDTLFSTYMIGNPMWKLNNTDADEIIVDPETFFVLKRCDELWRSTNGAFDVAVGKLIDIIGFEQGKPKLPIKKQIKEALAK